MPAARPSQAAVKNVIEALKAAGFVPGAVRVTADGGFTVEARDPSVDHEPAGTAKSPPKWGQR